MVFQEEELKMTRMGDYPIYCPVCNNYIETRETSQLPWNEDDELRFKCPECSLEFTIIPKYSFLGFYKVFFEEN